MVAKTFQNYEFLSDPFEKNGKMYIRVKNPKTGTERDVRHYTLNEYLKMYPEEKSNESPKIPTSTVEAPAAILGFDAKKALGFEKGYITIFKGDTSTCEEWFKLSPARYHCGWGWYVASSDEMPAVLPTEVSPVRLKWEEVSDNGNLKPQAAIKEIVESKIYEPSNSEYVGEVGDRLTLTVKVRQAIITDGLYGANTFHVFEDENGNAFTWATNAKSWEKGEVHTIKATVKEHKLYKNEKQTVLTRCVEEN